MPALGEHENKNKLSSLNVLCFSVGFRRQISPLVTGRQSTEGLKQKTAVTATLITAQLSLHITEISLQTSPTALFHFM